VADDPRCVRCGYALGGVVAGWRDRCPLEGTCSECGLGFEWVDVFDPKRLQPRWCVEFGSIWSAPGRAVRTLAITSTPWWFWGVRMSHPIRWGRLALYVVLLLALTYVVFAGAHAYRHAASYPQFRMPWLQMRVPVTPMERLEEAWKAFASPASESRRAFTWQGSPLQAMSPSHELRRRFHSIHMVKRTMRYLGPSLATVLLMPLMFVTMPVTRKRCRVGWGHIVRVGVYSLPTVLAPLWVLLVFLDVARTDVDRWIIGTGLFAIPAGLGIWWYVAIRQYLKLPQAGWTAGLFTLIGVLALLAIGYFNLASFEFYEMIFGL
jgi:hypothetical protein